jgi:hypothetical protein
MPRVKEPLLVLVILALQSCAEPTSTPIDATAIAAPDVPDGGSTSPPDSPEATVASQPLEPLTDQAEIARLKSDPDYACPDAQAMISGGYIPPAEACGALDAVVNIDVWNYCEEPADGFRFELSGFGNYTPAISEPYAMAPFELATPTITSGPAPHITWLDQSAVVEHTGSSHFGYEAYVENSLDLDHSVRAQWLTGTAAIADCYVEARAVEWAYGAAVTATLTGGGGFHFLPSAPASTSSYVSTGYYRATAPLAVEDLVRGSSVYARSTWVHRDRQLRARDRLDTVIPLERETEFVVLLTQYAEQPGASPEGDERHRPYLLTFHGVRAWLPAAPPTTPWPPIPHEVTPVDD